MQISLPGLRPTMHNIGARFAYLPRTLGLVWAAAPRWTIVWGLLLAVQGILPAAMVYVTRLLVDSLVHAIGAGGDWQAIQPAVVLIAFAAGIMLLTEVLQSVSDWIRTAQAELVQDHISALVHAQSAAVDMAFYESPEYYDRLDRARSDASHRSLALLEGSGSIVQNSITLFAMGAILIPYGVWLPLVLLASTLPALYVVLHFDQHFHRWWEQTTADRRWSQYYDTMLTHSMVAPELRLFGLGTHFHSAYQALRHRLRAGRLKVMRDQSLARMVAGVVGLVVAGATMAWMVWRAFQGLVTLGDLALFYQAFNRGQTLMRALLRSLGQLYSNSLFLGNLFEFLTLKPQVVDPPDPQPIPTVLQHGISFRNVRFRYPGSARVALNNFNLTIPAGQIVAIVGANGAGKSTLVKLLCRFYDPEAGQITLDGADLRRQITILFQLPVYYHATAGQNIAIGDLAAAPGATAIEAAARSAGAHDVIARLPQGYNTLLGKWFANGTELSGGEWQRVALARAFLRQSQIIVLDEPTSFMDSWAEAAWFERFRALAQGRTAIVITHRFTIAMRADSIHVMDGGRIVESGNHDQLLAQEGLYAQSWATQMQAGARCAPTYAQSSTGTLL